MRPLKPLSLVATLTLLTACVTINVYFPAAAAEQAADRIVRDVWGQESNKPDEPQQQQEPAEPDQDGAPDQGKAAPPAALRLLAALIPAAQAQQPQIDISSPAIRRLTKAMEQRHQQLRPFYQSGAIGLTQDALVKVRDLNAVSLPDRGKVRELVAAENRDRNALYREIARANDHPEWEPRIRGVFAERWIDNAQSGWYYQDDAGEWVRK